MCKLTYDRIARRLVYLHLEADPDRSILWSWIPLKKTRWVWKVWSFALWQQ